MALQAEGAAPGNWRVARSDWVVPLSALMPQPRAGYKVIRNRLVCQEGEPAEMKTKLQVLKPLALVRQRLVLPLLECASADRPDDYHAANEFGGFRRVTIWPSTWQWPAPARSASNGQFNGTNLPNNNVPIATVAGNGIPSYSGDGGAATNAGLYDPYGVALDIAGNLYIAGHAQSAHPQGGHPWCY